MNDPYQPPTEPQAAPSPETAQPACGRSESWNAGSQAPGEGGPSPEESYPFWTYRDVAMLIGVGFFLSIVIGWVAHAVFSGPATAMQAIVVTFAVEGSWLGLLYGTIRFGYGRPFWRSMAWLPTHFGVLRPMALGVMTSVVVVLVSSLMPRPPEHTFMEQLLRDRGSVILVGCFAVTLGPIFEELVFRGFLMPLLMRSFGAIAAVALQAIPFALLHGPEYGWAWQQLILMFLAGAAFGVMRYKSGSIATATYMHGGYNLVVFVGIMGQNLLHLH